MSNPRACASRGRSSFRQRVAALPDRLKLEKRKNRKAAAERYEPIKGHFPGADYPLAVAQIDHTPMNVIVVDEEHRQPIQRPFLTVVIDVFSRTVLGFAILSSWRSRSPSQQGSRFRMQYCPKSSGSPKSACRPSGLAGGKCAKSTATMRRSFGAQ